MPADQSEREGILEFCYWKDPTGWFLSPGDSSSGQEAGCAKVRLPHVDTLTTRSMAGKDSSIAVRGLHDHPVFSCALVYSAKEPSRTASACTTALFLSRSSSGR